MSGTPSRVRTQVDSVDKNLPPLAGLEPSVFRSTAIQTLCSAIDQTAKLRVLLQSTEWIFVSVVVSGRQHRIKLTDNGAR